VVDTLTVRDVDVHIEEGVCTMGGLTSISNIAFLDLERAKLTAREGRQRASYTIVFSSFDLIGAGAR
jgi:hypothetical protein